MFLVLLHVENWSMSSIRLFSFQEEGTKNLNLLQHCKKEYIWAVNINESYNKLKSICILFLINTMPPSHFKVVLSHRLASNEIETLATTWKMFPHPRIVEKVPIRANSTRTQVRRSIREGHKRSKQKPQNFADPHRPSIHHHKPHERQNVIAHPYTYIRPTDE